ncbi:MAG TPA: hypothetical protein VFA70_15190 [Dehalococcoidia bacterium]|jgi:hypothetical protein|nr:hypothetical protein [Dehalococcoidia bacterium]
MTESEEAARAALAAYLAAWNSADVAAWRETMNYPHIGLGPRGEVRIEQTAADVLDPFPGIRQHEGWHTSTQEEFTVIGSSPTKVHCQVITKRFHADGTPYARFLSFYILTEQNGHWGVQFSSGLPAPPAPA